MCLKLNRRPFSWILGCKHREFVGWGEHEKSSDVGRMLAGNLYAWVRVAIWNSTKADQRTKLRRKTICSIRSRGFHFGWLQPCSLASAQSRSRGRKLRHPQTLPSPSTLKY